VAIQKGIEMEKEGADILDVGAESSRPGAEPISEEEELMRLLPVIEGLLAHVKIPISVDTYKSAIAREALKKGVHIINDISGLRFDPDMKDVIAEYQAGVVLMHIKGKPKDMQHNPHYEDLMGEISTYLAESAAMAVAAGIPRQNIVIDPGIGFGKQLMDNYEILRSLTSLKELGYPLLIGPSKKSFIGNVLNVKPDQRLEGTAAAVSLGIHYGAHIVRVHDVKEMIRVIRIADLIVGKTKILSN